MTVGEKIRYFRKKCGITQGRLAELSDIHPVSIRKYETNKTQPQPAQIAKIADALGINTIALTGTDTLKFNTAGNVMGVLLLLLNSGILKMTWDNAGLGRPIVSSVKITVNPVFASFLSVGNEGDNSTTDLNNLFLKVTKPEFFGDLLSYYAYKEMQKADSEKGKTAENDAYYKQLLELIESQENWLQSDPELFETVMNNNLEIHHKEKSAIIDQG